MSVYKLHTLWFVVGECIFMAWNSINDPLFGWWIDNKRSEPERRKMKLNAIRFGGMVWCIAFMLIFSPWSRGSTGPAALVDHDEGNRWQDLEAKRQQEEAEEAASSSLSGDSLLAALHFTLSLCLYDGCLSLVMLAHGSLLADLSVSSADRATCNTYNSALSIFGSCGVFVCHMFWEIDGDLSAFSTNLFLLTAVAFIGFQVTAIFLWPKPTPPAAHHPHSDAYDPHKKPTSDAAVWNSSTSSSSEKMKKDKKKDKRPPYVLFLKQLCRQQNFVLFTAINLVQVFNCHFNSNFFSIFADSFLKDALPQLWIQALLLCTASLLPHLLVVVLSPFVKRYSLFKVIRFLFYLKLSFSVIAFCFQSGGWVVVMLFMISNKVFSEAICRHGNLVPASLLCHITHTHH